MFEKLLHLPGKASEDQSKIISTLFAVWNDMLIQHQPIIDAEIIQRFYQWSDRKNKYEKGQLKDALNWIGKEDLVPKGFGPPIKRKKDR